MILEMKVPSPGESITEVEIAAWLVKDGDYVEEDQALAEVDSDKATLELPAEESGVITLKAAEGDTLAVGDVICLIDTEAQKAAGNLDHETASNLGTVAGPTTPAAKTVEEPAATPAQRPKTYATGAPSPAARKILAERGLSAAQVDGSGKDGRITKSDALQAKPSMGTPGVGSRASTREKRSTLRRKLADRLVSVKNQTAMLTTFNEVDMQAIFQLRSQYKEAFKEKHGVSLGFMSFFTKAVVKALQAFPEVNSMIDGDYAVHFDYCDISIAVSGPKGLVVPVVRNAENRSFRDIEQTIKQLADKARDNRLSVDEMTGGTFTVTNGGVFGSMLSTPILNPPQSAILGMHNIVERPVALDGQVVIRPIMYVALSYDHRVIDGRESVGFLMAVKTALENPVDELMGGPDQTAQALEL